MVMAHGFAPIRHRKIGVKLFGFLKGEGSLVKLKTVKLLYALDETRLSGRRAGGWKGNDAKLLALRMRGRTIRKDERECRREAKSLCCHASPPHLQQDFGFAAYGLLSTIQWGKNIPTPALSGTCVAAQLSGVRLRVSRIQLAINNCFGNEVDCWAALFSMPGASLCFFHSTSIDPKGRPCGTIPNQPREQCHAAHDEG